MSRQERTEQLDTLLKEFEWTWTKAVLMCLVLTIFVFLTAIILPSFWTYYSEQKLGWGGPTDIETAVSATGELIKHPVATYNKIGWSEGDDGPFISVVKNPILTVEKIGHAIPADLGKQIRDAIAMGITTVFFVLPFAVGTILQNKRRKLRGANDSRPGGGYK